MGLIAGATGLKLTARVMERAVDFLGREKIIEPGTAKITSAGLKFLKNIGVSPKKLTPAQRKRLGVLESAAVTSAVATDSTLPQ